VSGGALVLLLIVRNFQYGTCNGLTGKFAMLLVFSLGEYESLLEAGSRNRRSWDGAVKARDRRISDTF
jgi:hypothetical protein